MTKKRTILMLSKTLVYASGALLCLLIVRGDLKAQIAEGSMVGFVIDSSGAAVPGSSVEATNVATGVLTKTTTNSIGYYEFPLLAVGTYTIAVKQPGFQQAIVANIVLHSGDKLRTDVKLLVGRETQTVQVTATAPLVNATTTDLGTVIGSTEISQMPLNGRSFTELLVLEPGWNSGDNEAQRGGVSLSGLSGLGNNFLLDGVDMSYGENNGVGMGAAGGPATLINSVSIDALEELKVTTGAAAAQYGRVSGGTVNLTTKSGTNHFHGAAWEYFRNDDLDANGFFNNAEGLGSPELRQNQFGANLGGPILHDKLFFFFNYEGARVLSGQTVSAVNPTALLLNQLTNPAMRSYFQMWDPLPTIPTSNPLVGEYFRNGDATDTENTTVTRVDADLGKSRLTYRMVINGQQAVYPVFPTPLIAYFFPLPEHNFEASWTYMIAPTLINEFRFGYQHNPDAENAHAFNTAYDTNVPGAGLLTSAANFVELEASGITQVDLNDSLSANAPTKSIVDDLTWVHGAHTLKAGIFLRRTDAKRVQYGQGVWYEYNSLAQMIADSPSNFELDFGNPGTYGFDFWTFDTYAQDSWKVNRRLTVNYGLHWNYFQPLSASIGFATSNPFGPTTPLGAPLWHSQYADFAPRVGIVYDLTGSGKTVIRLGGGTYYGAAQPFFLYNGNFLSATVPAFPVVVPSDLPPSLNIAFPNLNGTYLAEVRANPASAPAGLAGGISAPDPNHHDEYSTQYNATLEHQLTPSLVASASYVGSRTLHGFSSVLENPLNPTTGIRPYANIGPIYQYTYSGRLWYNALELALRKTTSHGLSLGVFYTYSKSMDYGCSDQNENGNDRCDQDMTDLDASIGPTPGQVTQRFQADYVYTLPTFGLTRNSALARETLGGWSLQGIMGAVSGESLNVVSGVDSAGLGYSISDRPDAVPGVSPYLAGKGSGANRLNWLNPAAYNAAAPVAQKRLGNLGFDTVYGPGGFTWDMSLHKAWKIHESQEVTFRFEAFNALNHVVLGNPTVSTASAIFGQITSGSSGRELQLALRYSF